MTFSFIMVLAMALSARPIGMPLKEVARSPDNHFEVVSSKGDTSEYKPYLMLRDLKAGQTVRFYDFDRSVDVLWAPDSKHFAVTDYAGSAEAVLMVFQPTELSSPLSVSLPKRLEALIKSCDHSYITAVRWKSSKRLLVNLYAYGVLPGPIVDKNFVFRLPSQ